MAYVSKKGKRPAEWASKSAHGHVIKDAAVVEFLERCSMPKKAGEVGLDPSRLLNFQLPATNPIHHVIAVDGGFTEVAVQTEFPSATICFFQFGALIFDVKDLEDLEEQAFIDPDDMAKLKRIQRIKFTLPVRNVTLKGETTLTGSVRQAVYEFFRTDMDDGKLIDTLQWLIYQEYDNPIPAWTLASCPLCENANIQLRRASMSAAHTFACDYCGGELFLTDVFRLHEAVDDELGAGGILGYVVTTFEQIILAHLIRLILKKKPGLLDHVLFIKDGPLGFFGQTANLHKPMRAMVRYLFKNYNLYLAGLEKSGAFVEHADEIAQKVNPGTIILLDNDYIYKYVLPGKADSGKPYGGTSYYGNKLILKTPGGRMYVATLPTQKVLDAPVATDFPNLQVILANIEKLKCDMYDDALIPVALVNKLVSLANHPSSRILQKFAVGTLNG